MEGLITSCGRFDLLKETLDSFYKNQQQKVFMTIHDDALTRIGQHGSIEKFLNKAEGKYYFHCEEDWSFENSFDWIKASVDIMESDPMIIKVLCRKDSQHPCIYDKELNGIKYGSLQSDWYHEGITWQGFSWNPGVTRLDLIKQFVPFKKWEQDVAEDIENAGYKVVELENKIYKHIGYERSTH